MVDDEISRAMDVADAGNHRWVIEHMAVYAGPFVAEASFVLGNSLTALGDDEEAVVAFARARELGCDDAAYNEGICLEILGRDQEAKSTYGIAAGLGDPKALVALAQFAAEADDLEEALRLAGQATGLDVEEARFRDALVTAWKWGLSPTLSLEPQLWDACSSAIEARLALAELLDEKGEAAAAIDVLREGAKEDPALACLPLGNLLARTGDLAGARAAYEQGIAHGDRNSHYNLAVLLVQMGFEVDAEKHIQQGAEAGDVLASEVLASIKDPTRRAAAFSRLRTLE